MLRSLYRAGFEASRVAGIAPVTRQHIVSYKQQYQRRFSTRTSPLLHQGENGNKAEDEASVSSDTDSSSSSSEEPSTKANSDGSNEAWRIVIDSLAGPNDSKYSFGDGHGQSDINLVTSGKPMDRKAMFEALWRDRSTRGPQMPAKPSAGRTCDIDGVNIDAARGYSILNSILARNNIRYQLRLGERYEKPNQERRRLRSQRHRRRFADAVRQKVQLIMELKARGA